MSKIAVACVLLTAAVAFAEEAAETEPSEKEDDVPAALNFEMKDITGEPVKLAERYDDKVVLMVNVASQCGLTPQYKQLQELHEKYHDKGLRIAAFPANNFGKQEPGSDEEIKAFCTNEYGVEFDLYSKISVKGEDQAPLYKHLTALETEPVGAGEISWNFEKFLLSREGEVIARFAPRTRPDDEAVIETIEAELAKDR